LTNIETQLKKLLANHAKTGQPMLCPILSCLRSVYAIRIVVDDSVLGWCTQRGKGAILVPIFTLDLFRQVTRTCAVSWDNFSATMAITQGWISPDSREKSEASAL
jgi:hypothetical protein